MVVLGSQMTVSPSGYTSVGTPALHLGIVALVIPIARPFAVGPCGCMRPALHLKTSRSPARPRIVAGASNVSQNAASANPHPGLAIGPTGDVPSAPTETIASIRAAPPTPPEDASVAGDAPPPPPT